MNTEQDEEMMAKSDAANDKHGFQRCAACGAFRPKGRLKKNETAFPSRRPDALVCLDEGFCRPIADERESERIAKAAKLEAAKGRVTDVLTAVMKHELEFNAAKDDYEYSPDAVSKLFTIAIKSVKGAR